MALDRVKYRFKFFSPRQQLWMWVLTSSHHRCQGCGMEGWNDLCRRCKGAGHTSCVANGCAPCLEEQYGGP